MSPAEVLRRLRFFLRALASVIFAGTLLELWLVSHNEDAIQWTAFILAGLGLLLSAMIIARQGPVTVALLRWSMLVVIAGSLFGVYQHVYNNIAFEREIQPNATTNRLIWRGLSGPNPLLAPATLAMASLLSLASTYKQSHTIEPE